MAGRKAILKVTVGPNQGDSMTIEFGACRLVGRHLADTETVLLGKDGNRVLDKASSALLQRHLKDKIPNPPLQDFIDDAFHRGADIVFSDDSISRAHAMLFFGETGLGVVDLASTNGTYINHERIASSHLEDGDVLTLGDTELSVRLE